MRSFGKTADIPRSLRLYPNTTGSDRSTDIMGPFKAFVCGLRHFQIRSTAGRYQASPRPGRGSKTQARLTSMLMLFPQNPSGWVELAAHIADLPNWSWPHPQHALPETIRVDRYQYPRGSLQILTCDVVWVGSETASKQEGHGQSTFGRCRCWP